MVKNLHSDRSPHRGTHSVLSEVGGGGQGQVSEQGHPQCPLGVGGGWGKDTFNRGQGRRTVRVYTAASNLFSGSRPGRNRYFFARSGSNFLYFIKSQFEHIQQDRQIIFYCEEHDRDF